MGWSLDIRWWGSHTSTPPSEGFILFKNFGLGYDDAGGLNLHIGPGVGFPFGRTDPLPMDR